MGLETKLSSGKSVHEDSNGTLSDEEVVTYLSQHADFLARHPQLLAAMVVPHECGSAASLIEHQVHVLKQQAAQLRGKFKDLMANAHQNEELSQRIHRLVLSLVQARELDECLTGLYQGMAENFGADLICLRIFAQPRDTHNQGLGEFADQDSSELFQSVFAQGNPVCGQASSAQLEFLFRDQASSAKSTALVPVKIGYEHDDKDQLCSRALLAIGSKNAARFQPGMGTVYLRQMAELLGQILHRHVS